MFWRAQHTTRDCSCIHRILWSFLTYAAQQYTWPRQLLCTWTCMHTATQLNTITDCFQKSPKKPTTYSLSPYEPSDPSKSRGHLTMLEGVTATPLRWKLKHHTWLATGQLLVSVKSPTQRYYIALYLSRPLNKFLFYFYLVLFQLIPISLFSVCLGFFVPGLAGLL